jgi:RNA polymerase sigma factor (sigma-70 family)
MHGKILFLPDDDALVAECRKQNRFAQKFLFDKYFNKMMTVCLRYLKNEDDALEALNNSFLKVFSKISQFKSEGNLESWIKKIVINSSIDFVRSNKSYRANFIQTNEFHLYGEPEEENFPEELTDEMDFSKEEIFEMVETLPPATRIVFNLYVIDEYSHRQVSENLKISEGTSKWHLSNARKILKSKINETIIAKKKLNHGKEKTEHR